MNKKSQVRVLGLVRPLVRRLKPYVPGEQPKVKGLIKLNTNENPYHPSRKVLQAVRAAADGRLRLYPNPTAELLRSKLAALHSCSPENIIVGNGSDELLAMAVRCFVEPARQSSNPSRSTVQFFSPSYSLYPVLAEMHGAMARPVPLEADFGIPPVLELCASGWDRNAALSFVTTPNAPSGRAYATAQLEALCRTQHGVVVLDEAYVDFAEENALELALRFPQVLVARTFSKAYSLCFQRIGYFVGHPHLIEALNKIRDSYNVNGLGQVAATATLDDLEYYRRNFKKIVATRQRLSEALNDLGFQVLPSQTNFVLVKPPTLPARNWLEKLRRKKILVRWFDQAGIREYLRITIGTEAEVGRLVAALRGVVREA